MKAGRRATRRTRVESFLGQAGRKLTRTSQEDTEEQPTLPFPEYNIACRYASPSTLEGWVARSVFTLDDRACLPSRGLPNFNAWKRRIFDFARMKSLFPMDQMSRVYWISWGIPPFKHSSAP